MTLTQVVPGTCQAVSPTGQIYDPGTPGEHGAPDILAGYLSRRALDARTFMVVANNPVAARAGCDILQAGGSAVDAAVAVQMVLNLTEPQSSGIGGGGFLVYYDAQTHAVRTYDGRETAPAAATGNYLRWISDSQQTPPVPDNGSGRSIGTPGILALLETAHKDAGVLPWADLFAPAIRLATSGIRISPRLAASILNAVTGLGRDDNARSIYLDAGKPRAQGTTLTNPALARTFQAIADGGAAAFYTGPIAQDIVDEVASTAGGTITPGQLTLADLAGYRAQVRDPVCTTYRDHEVCGMGPPSSGGIAVAQILGILEHTPIAAERVPMVDVNGGRPTVAAVHLVAEAERLAYADRDRYVADADVVPLPGGSPAALVDPAYLLTRAGLIDVDHSMGTAAPGNFGSALGTPPPVPEHGTSQITIVDGQGNAVAMTTSVNFEFGSLHVTRSGFVLNNQLDDFSVAPSDGAGAPIANAVAGGKRPRSSMAPTLVFQRSTGQRQLELATGSPGGAAIIQYVAKALIGVLDWGLDAQQACALVNFGAENTPVTNIGGESPELDVRNGGANDPLITGLEALGHRINLLGQFSGLGTIVVRGGASGTYYEGGADPRREGIVLGDTFKP